MSKVLRLTPNAVYETERRKIPVHAVVVNAEHAQTENSEPESTVDHRKDDETAAPNLEEVRLLAESLLADAKAEAERLLAEAAAEAEQIREAAHEAGYQAGYDVGVAEAKRELEGERERQLQQVRAVMDKAQEHRRRMIQSMGTPLVQICMTAVKELLKRELVLQPADIECMVMDILPAALECTRAEVRVHPDDYPLAVDAHPAWQSAKFGAWEVAVVPDPSIDRGGCEVRWDAGRADAKLETKLDMLESALVEFFERSVSEDAAAILG